MALEALTPAPPRHRRFLDTGFKSCRLAKRSKLVSDDEYLAGCLVALRRGGEASSSASDTPSAARIYKCGVCGKGFPSHQALGGHKASHRNKPPTDAVDHTKPSDPTSIDAAAPGPHRLHTCATCGKSFPTGQALGGHMRKHYGGSASASDGGNGDGFSGVTSFSGGGDLSCSNGDGNGDVTAISRGFDLNLPPSLEELDLALTL